MAEPKQPAASSSGSTAASEESSSDASLEELKRLGAERSSYHKRQRPEIYEEAPKPQLETFRQSVEPVLADSCLYCHGPDAQEGNIRLDTLDPDLLNGDDADWWLEVFAVVSKGEMPPADAGDLEGEDRAAIVDWLSTELQTASRVQRAEQGHSSFRRMTRYEYKYALQDLLGLPFDFGRDLPPESTSEDGFQNSSEMLHMTSMQFATYRELGRKALEQATVRGDQPAPIYWEIPMGTALDDADKKLRKRLKQAHIDNKDNPEDLKRTIASIQRSFEVKPNRTHYHDLSTGVMKHAAWRYLGAHYAWDFSREKPETPPVSSRVAVIPRGKLLVVELGDQIPDRGTLRVRVRASRATPGDGPAPSMQLEFGWQSSNDSEAAVRVSKHDIAVDAQPGAPAFYEWNIPLGDIVPRNSFRGTQKMGQLPSPSEYLRIVNSSPAKRNLHVEYIEVSANDYAVWPPESHRQVFIASENEDDEPAYAREILGSFMPRAWRRPVTQAELDRKLELFADVRPGCEDFQQAMIEVLSTVLSAPQFIYLDRPASATDYDLATRLSMFLWCSSPDDELKVLAAEGKLRDQQVLVEQVERMLASPRADRFSEQFVRQWLGMQLLDYLKVDAEEYPKFDPALKEAMQQEPLLFFREVLKQDASVLDFLHSDYTIVNERLAKHYGIDGIEGNHFRRVALPAVLQRGGLLTQAGLLAMNSDGKDSHPLKRGIWLMESLLNDPPPPPPPAVPEIDLADPRILEMTLKERIEDHRNDPACFSCHAKIDPWGIAFENYDAIGRWRDKVRGKRVDASSLLFDRYELAGVEGVKRFLLEERQDQFVRAMVHKLTTYALGRPLAFGDRAEIDEITARARKQGDGLATIITLIVTSDLFQSM